MDQVKKTKYIGSPSRTYQPPIPPIRMPACSNNAIETIFIFMYFRNCFKNVETSIIFFIKNYSTKILSHCYSGYWILIKIVGVNKDILLLYPWKGQYYTICIAKD